MISTITDDKILIQFDGVCILCSNAVRYILKVDKKRKFRFKALQYSATQESYETIVVIHQGNTYQYMDAIFKIAKELGGINRIVLIFKILPKNWQKGVYLWVSRNRFQWFGKRNSCFIPEDQDKERFI